MASGLHLEQYLETSRLKKSNPTLLKDASIRCIQHRLQRDLQLPCRRAARKPLLMDRMKKARLDFAKKYIHWTADDWKKVMWSCGHHIQVYSGPFYHSLENLPTELQRNFHLMRDLDQRSQDVMRNIDQISDDYLTTVKSLSPEKRSEQMSKIQKMFNRAKEYSDDKVQLAIQTYELAQLTRTLELQPLYLKEIICLQSNPPLLLPSGFTITLVRETIQTYTLSKGDLRLCTAEMSNFLR
ncbi:Inhibitor of growth protein 5 [Chionoecetes opilio]|uniref:Inhibitor of growth protein 5 n=1 Tax=Chionoecetes opilio TaxID=41210 RepID=A0A8J4Y8U4_CHIOP|nr:Inhibitor of growth protein 5 [Chionoecetes opilio]